MKSFCCEEDWFVFYESIVFNPISTYSCSIMIIYCLWKTDWWDLFLIYWRKLTVWLTMRLFFLCHHNHWDRLISNCLLFWSDYIVCMFSHCRHCPNWRMIFGYWLLGSIYTSLCDGLSLMKSRLFWVYILSVLKRWIRIDWRVQW